MYDLSGIVAPLDSDDNLVSMGICANNADTGNGDDPCEPALINQFYSTLHAGCNAYLAKWDRSAVKVGPVDAGYTGLSDGIKLSLKNGQECPGAGPREVHINFLCSTGDASSFTVREDSTCVYDIEYKTTHACGKQPVPPEVWGINGTFAGTFTTLSDNSTKQIQIQGDCKHMAAVTSGNGGTEIWQLMTAECSGKYGSGTMKSVKSGKTYNYNAFLLTNSSPYQLKLVIMDSDFPFEVLFMVEALRG